MKYQTDISEKDIFNSPLMTRDVLIADDTGFSKLVLYGILTDLKENAVFCFSELGVRTTKNSQTRHLTTTPNTIATPADDEITITEDFPEDQETVIENGHFEQLNISMRKACRNCRATIDPLPNTACSFKCTCGMRQRVSSILVLMRANIDITKDSKVYKLTAYEAVILPFLKHHKFCVDPDTTTDEMEEFCLNLENATITFNDENIITKMT